MYVSVESWREVQLVVAGAVPALKRAGLQSTSKLKSGARRPGGSAMRRFLPALASAYGSREAAELSEAYEAALLTISGGTLGPLPDEAVQLVLVQAMLTEGQCNGFIFDGLKQAGLAAVLSE